MTDRVLLVDIETFPQLGWTWVSYDTNVIAVKEPWSVCSFSAKWLNGKQITRTLSDVGDEAGLLMELWDLLNDADVVVAHNGDQFDIRKINARMLVHGLTPPSPFRTVDTKKVAKRVFGFTSNKLDDLCQQLGIGKKLRHEGFDLWLGCMSDNPTSWKTMRKYNAHDVVLLEGLYLRMLPWSKNHPNISAVPNGCPKCGSTDLQSRGTARNQVRVYQRYQCLGCGGWCRSTQAELSSKVVNA